MSESFISWFSDINDKKISLIGKKAANVSKLFNSGFPVPQGFVLNSKALNYFLRENDLVDEIRSLLKKVDVENGDSVNKRSKEIRTLILNGDMPDSLLNDILEAYDNFNVDLEDFKEMPGALAILKSSREGIFVSVRLSLLGEDSFSKQQNVSINVKGNRDLIEKVKLCFSSVFSPNAIYYRRKNGFDDFEGAGVIVQRMINSDKSGAVFSKNPDDQNDDVLVESIFGQGGSPISKRIVPDRYVLTRDMEIINEVIGEKKVAVVRNAGGQTKAVQLDEEYSFKRTLKIYEIKQLADYALGVEELMGCPQVVDFAIENEEFYILGCRDIESSIVGGNVSSKDVLPVVDVKAEIRSVVSSAADAVRTKGSGLDGLIVKIERIVARAEKHPLEYLEEGSLDKYRKLISGGIGKICEEGGAKSIWVRTGNFRSDEYSGIGTIELAREINPMMGNHGVRFSLKHEDILKSELLAIKDLVDDGYEVGVLIPNVISPDEVRRVTEIIKDVGLDGVELGVVIETPASAILIKDICEVGINFVCFDIESLTGYTLAVDRGNGDVCDLFDESHWAVLKLISRVIRQCQDSKVKTCLMGNTPIGDDLINFLVERGIDSVAGLPFDVRRISEVVCESEGGNLEESDIQEREVGNANLGKGGDEMRNEEDSAKEIAEEDLSEDDGKEDEEIEGAIDDDEDVANDLDESEDDVVNPLEPEQEPIVRHDFEMEKPNEEPRGEGNGDVDNPDEEPRDRPKAEDIFS